MNNTERVAWASLLRTMHSVQYAKSWNSRRAKRDIMECMRLYFFTYELHTMMLLLCNGPATCNMPPGCHVVPVLLC